MHTHPTWVMTLVAIGIGCGTVAVAAPKVADDTIPTVQQEEPAKKGGQGGISEMSAADKELFLRCQRESQRCAAIIEWADRTGADRQTLNTKLCAPIITGNKHDWPVNQRLAAQYQALLQKVQQERQSKVAVEKYAILAKAYAGIAAENEKILKNMEFSFNAAAHDASCEAIEEFEAQISELMGHPPRRSWFLRSELSFPRASKPAAPAAAVLPKTSKPATTGIKRATPPSATH